MRNRVITYIALLILSVATFVFLLTRAEYFYSGILVVIIVAMIMLLLKEYLNNTNKITYMLYALENDDTAFRFQDKNRKAYNFLYNTTLNRIKDMLSNEKLKAREQEKYFELLLANVTTGILTINDKGHVISVNDNTLEIFGLSVLTHINQIKRIDQSIYELFTSEKNEDRKLFSIYSESEKRHYSLKISQINIRGEELKVIVINDIGDELEVKEQESWTKLIRVLTHEIMNTITPISSLSETLSSVVGEDNQSLVKNKEMIRQGLEVIGSTSKGLISFVDSYRNLTRIPTPNRKPIYVKDIIRRVLTLQKEDLENNTIVTEVFIENNEIIVYADENLISQVIINIVKNGIAGIIALSENNSEVSKKYLNIKSYVDPSSEDVYIEISNNGVPISKEAQESIFIPFFTTKSSGTGIGLSISRQIMRLHDGLLKLKSSTEKETTFLLIFK